MRLTATEFDPATGIRENFYFDDATGKVHIQRVQDVEHNLARNRAEFNAHSKASYGDSKGGAHLVARIPLVVIEKWKEQGFDWFNSTDKERRAMLNKPEHRQLLVRPGRL